MEQDFVQDALKALRPDNPNWYGWAKYDDAGNKIPNDQRMCWEHAIVIQDGVTKPTRAEFDAKVAELRQNHIEDGIRNQRDNLLSFSDWIVIKSLEAGVAVPQEWLDYRQALRDLPQQTGFPDSITWPSVLQDSLQNQENK